MRYGIVDTLEFYDTEEAKNLFDNEYSWVNDEYSAQTIEWLRDVFVERRGIIRVSAYFYLEDARLVSPARSECPEENSMPNPHIYFFGCSGANDVYYSQYAKSGDWELAIEQSIAATKNWAVGDVAVSRKMFNWLINHDLVKCIYVTDGSPLERVTKDCKLVSLKEFVEITNRKKDEEKNTEEGEKSNG